MKKWIIITIALLNFSFLFGEESKEIFIGMGTATANHPCYLFHIHSEPLSIQFLMEMTKGIIEVDVTNHIIVKKNTENKYGLLFSISPLKFLYPIIGFSVQPRNEKNELGDSKRATEIKPLYGAQIMLTGAKNKLCIGFCNDIYLMVSILVSF